MAYSPVGLISLMDRVLRPVIAKVRDRQIPDQAGISAGSFSTI